MGKQVPSIPIDRQENRRRFIGVGTAILAGLALDVAYGWPPPVPLVALRVGWATIFAGTGVIAARVPQRAAMAMSPALGLVSVVLADQIVGQVGTDTVHFGWTIAFPFATALLIPERPAATTVVGALAAALAAVRVVGSDGSLVIAGAWVLGILLATALATHSAVRFALERQALFAAERAQAELTARLAQADERRREVERLAHLQQLATLGALTAGVGHEIRNPLSVIVANVDDLRDCDDAERQQIVDDVSDAAQRIAGIAQALGVASRRAGDNACACDVRRAIDDSLRLTRQRRQEVARVEVDVGDLPPVRISAVRLVQILVNLITNACDALAERGTDDDGHITIAASCRSDAVVLRVADSGPGIAPQVAVRLFEPFVTSKPEGAGTGLGLALCRMYVEETGGSIQLGSSNLGGAAFDVTLPTA